MSLVVLFVVCNRELLYGQNSSAKRSLLRLSGCEVMGSISEELQKQKVLNIQLNRLPILKGALWGYQTCIPNHLAKPNLWCITFILAKHLHRLHRCYKTEVLNYWYLVLFIRTPHKTADTCIGGSDGCHTISAITHLPPTTNLILPPTVHKHSYEYPYVGESLQRGGSLVAHTQCGWTVTINPHALYYCVQCIYCSNTVG